MNIFYYDFARQKYYCSIITIDCIGSRQTLTRICALTCKLADVAKFRKTYKYGVYTRSGILYN